MEQTNGLSLRLGACPYCDTDSPIEILQNLTADDPPMPRTQMRCVNCGQIREQYVIMPGGRVVMHYLWDKSDNAVTQNMVIFTAAPGIRQLSFDRDAQ